MVTKVGLLVVQQPLAASELHEWSGGDPPCVTDCVP